MSYIDQLDALRTVSERLPKQALAVLGDDLALILEEVGGTFELTMGEIGQMSELVRQVITKEKPPEGFEERLNEKLDEDNQPKAGDIVQALVEKIFAKLLPALGIKLPLEMAIKPKAPRPVPINKVIPPPPPPQAISYKPSAISSPQREPIIIKGFVGGPRGTYEQPQPTKPQELARNKPPIIETSHESLTDNPLQSLLKMLGGKISDRELEHQMSKLPDSLKSILGSLDAAKKVLDIGRAHALHVDKLGELGAETGMVILGFTRPSQFLSRLTRRLDLPADKVQPIAEEINNEIFLKIREALKNVHDYGESSVMGPATQAPKPQFPAFTPASAPVQVPTKTMAQAAPPVPTNAPMGQPGRAEFGGTSISPAGEDVEKLDREAILRGIENPSAIKFKTSTALSAPQPEKYETAKEKPPAQIPQPAPPKPPVQFPPKPALPASEKPAWKPPVPPAPPTIPVMAPKIPSAPVPPSQPISPRAVSAPTFSASPISSAAVNPPSAATAPKAAIPPPAPANPEDIIGQKLSGATSSTASEKLYSTDPYREPIQ